MEWNVKRETRMWPNIIYFNAKKIHWFPNLSLMMEIWNVSFIWFFGNWLHVVYLLQEHIKLVTKCFGEVVASATCSRSMCAGFPRHFVIVKEYLCIRLVYASFWKLNQVWHCRVLYVGVFTKSPNCMATFEIWHAYFAIDMSNLESLKFWMSPDFSWSMVQFWLHVTGDQWNEKPIKVKWRDETCWACMIWVSLSIDPRS